MLRNPSQNPSSATARSGLAALEYELMEERASSLGRQGRSVEAALAALSKISRDNPLYDRFLNSAADAVWALFVQRECCGLRNDDSVLADYAIPKDVLARLGGGSSTSKAPAVQLAVDLSA